MNLNKHFQNQVDSNNCSILPESVKTDILSDFHIMSNLGIDNFDDQNRFFIIRTIVPQLILSIYNKKINDELSKNISSELFRNKGEIPIDTMPALIEAIDLALNKMVPKNLRPKKAYPQKQTFLDRPQYNINKWVEITKQIYNLMAQGYTKSQAEQSVIGNWENMEKIDYKNWLKFYEEDVPAKYPKLASTYGSGIPVDALKSILPGKLSNPSANNAPYVSNKVSPGLPQNLPTDVSDVRDTIEKQRHKLIGRLNAAEKLLYSLDGQLFAGDEQELMLQLLQDLKRKVQVANKRTIHSTLFEDYIIKEANILHIKGLKKCANLLYKVAQLPPSPLDEFADKTAPTDSSVPMFSGEPGGESSGDKESDTHKLLEEFFDLLKTRVSGDPLDTPEERKEESKKATSTPEIIKEADVVPQPTHQFKTAPTPAQPATTEDATDDVIEAALSHITIKDVINRLEMLVSVYNQREIARQLAILDMMMDRLNIASYFPSLGEAMSKALEANQYIGSRLGEILSKVRGSVSTPGAQEWVEVSKDTSASPEIAAVQQNLKEQNDKEKQKRELRKQKEELELSQPKTPGFVPVGETAELREPARIEKSPKINVR